MFPHIICRKIKKEDTKTTFASEPDNIGVKMLSWVKTTFYTNAGGS